jgi:hypothetical protein
LYCLPVAGAVALLAISEYLERRITFVTEVIDNEFFKSPNDDDLNLIWEVVAETQEGLMASCDLQALVDELASFKNLYNWNEGQNRDQMAGLIECVCRLALATAQQGSNLLNLVRWENQDRVSYAVESETEAVYTPPVSDADRCEWSQCIYWYMYEMLTEVLLPFADEASDALVAAVVATGIFTSLASFIGLPIAIVTSLVVMLIDWAIDGSIANVTNWLIANRDELICELYKGLPSREQAYANVKAYCEGSGEISYLDAKVIIALMQPWHMGWIKLEQDTNSTWDPFLVPGQCDDCEEYPPSCYVVGMCDLADWSGGLVVCLDGWAVIQGGQATYIGADFDIPLSNAYLRVYWTPKSEAGEPARVDLGLTDGVIDYPTITNAEGPADIQRYDDGLIPNQLWGESGIQLYGVQDAWWAQIDAICIKEGPFE